MILIFGGAYQGKLAYALERFNPADKDVHRCCDEDAEMPEGSIIIYEIDKWILALIKAGADADEAVGRFIEANRGAVVICNDISCGIVPADPQMRQWREATGRAMARIAAESDEVIRLFCGIASRVK